MNTTKREISNIIRKLGLTRSNYSASSRVSGWGSNTEGISFSEVYPFKNRYQRSNKYHYWYSKDEAHEMRISYDFSSYKHQSTGEEVAAFKQRASEQMGKLLSYLTLHDIKHVVENDDIKVFITNPFYGKQNFCRSCDSIH